MSQLPLPLSSYRGDLSDRPIEEVIHRNYKLVLKFCRRTSGSSRLAQLKRFDEVVDLYSRCTDHETGELLLRRDHSVWSSIENVRDEIAAGNYLNSTKIPMYSFEGKECRGLQLYRCDQGSSPLEGLHSYVSPLLGRHAHSPELSYYSTQRLFGHWSLRAERQHLGAADIPSYDKAMLEEINLLHQELVGVTLRREANR